MEPPAADRVETFTSEAEFLDWLRPGDPFGNAPQFYDFTEELVTEAMESLPGQAARQALEHILDRKYESMTA